MLAGTCLSDAPRPNGHAPAARDRDRPDASHHLTLGSKSVVNKALATLLVQQMEVLGNDGGNPA